MNKAYIPNILNILFMVSTKFSQLKTLWDRENKMLGSSLSTCSINIMFKLELGVKRSKFNLPL